MFVVYKGYVGILNRDRYEDTMTRMRVGRLGDFQQLSFCTLFFIFSTCSGEKVRAAYLFCEILEEMLRNIPALAFPHASHPLNPRRCRGLRPFFELFALGDIKLGSGSTEEGDLVVHPGNRFNDVRANIGK